MVRDEPHCMVRQVLSILTPSPANVSQTKFCKGKLADDGSLHIMEDNCRESKKKIISTVVMITKSP